MCAGLRYDERKAGGGGNAGTLTRFQTNEDSKSTEKTTKQNHLFVTLTSFFIEKSKKYFVKN